ncbi:ABC transporter ATP-binding protein [Candidatus Saccharibacteria bacterium]|nr:ABC transporter ATP-binding protein [Candidatus Saccharibacteria bacterium]NCU38947.1 ABC transporter ATP-binding protein [Candidatus Saccharibacteria bacterium]
MIKNVLGKYRIVYSYLGRSYGRSWLFRLSFVLQIVKNALKFVLLPVALSRMLAQLAGSDFDAALQSAIIFSCGSAFIGIVAPLVKYVGMIGENKVYAKETGVYFGKLMGADIDYFYSNLAGYLTTATRQYVDSGVQLVRAIRDSYAQTVMAFLFPIIVITVTNWMLGLVVALLSVIQTVYMLWSSSALEPYRLRSRELYKKNSGVMADAISNILAVKAAGREEDIVKSVRENATIESVSFRKRYAVRAKLTAGREVVTVITYFGVLFMAVELARSGALSLQGVILITTYITPIFTAIYAFAEAVDEHDDYIDKLIPGFELMELTHSVNDPKSPRKLDSVHGEIEFDNVRFAYDKERFGAEVLGNFSLTVPAGQKLGIVGLSGAGKSTMTKLLLRFADIDAGVIRIDGIDIRDFRQADLRRQIAYVPQEPLLFHASIRDNVLFARPDASEEELIYALEVANAKQVVDNLSHGLNSIVGERGIKLSGGQKQRIAIARAVLQETRIIVLDEATSALDSESEKAIKESFKEVLCDKTAIVVAHRLSTLSDMDRIIVMDGGKIAEDGTHDELIRQDGLYARLWQRQQKIT